MPGNDDKENKAPGQNASAENTDRVASNIETIATLHAAAERSVPRHQRLIETLTGHLGRPISFYLMICFVVLWIAINVFARHAHLAHYDPSPFSGLQAIVSISSLLVSTMVLITQNRQARLAEQRSHFDIQVNLLAEQKITKLIALVEELREDLPNVRNRSDPEAEEMKHAADPQTVVEELKRTLEEAAIIEEQTEIE
jgi:uncharacterized membrane protein